MKIPVRIRRVKESAERALLKRPGVTGVGIGYKYVGGKRTDQLAIRISVREKKDVPDSERIPADIEGIPTDVLQQEFTFHAFANPLEGGNSVGPTRPLPKPPGKGVGISFSSGTAAILVIDNATGNKMVLSCSHVLCVPGWR